MSTIAAGNWSETVGIPEAKSNGWLMSDGRHLFYAGGSTATRTSGSPEVFQALLGSDGGIASWQLAGVTPKNMAFFSGSITKGYMVLAGGNTASPVDSVYVAKLASDGGLGAFSYLQAPISSFRNPGCAIYKDTIYYVGGNVSGSAGDEVWLGKVSTSGGSFTQGPYLPSGRAGGVAFVYNGYLFYAGGSTDGAFTGVTGDVLSAKIADDGSLSPWKLVGGMPVALHRFSATIHRNRLIIMGGQDINASNVGSMWVAPIERDGTIGAWSLDDAGIPVAHRNGCAAVVGDRLYLVSGFAAARISNCYVLKLR